MYYYFVSAAVTVDSNHMTLSSFASWSRFSLPSNFVNGHVSTMWFMVSRWPQSQEGDRVRPYLCKLAGHCLWLLEMVHQRLCMMVSALAPSCYFWLGLGSTLKFPPLHWLSWLGSAEPVCTHIVYDTTLNGTRCLDWCQYILWLCLVDDMNAWRRWIKPLKCQKS